MRLLVQLSSAGAMLHVSTRKEGKLRDPLRKGNKEEARRGREHRTRKEREMGARC